jgi:hypothetical protein
MLRGVMLARLPSTNRRGSPQVAGENGREGERYVVLSVAIPIREPPALPRIDPTRRVEDIQSIEKLARLCMLVIRSEQVARHYGCRRRGDDKHLDHLRACRREAGFESFQPPREIPADHLSLAPAWVVALSVEIKMSGGMRAIG